MNPSSSFLLKERLDLSTQKQFCSNSCSSLSYRRKAIVCCHIIAAVNSAFIGFSGCVSCLLSLPQTTPPPLIAFYWWLYYNEVWGFRAESISPSSFPSRGATFGYRHFFCFYSGRKRKAAVWKRHPSSACTKCILINQCASLLGDNWTQSSCCPVRSRLGWIECFSCKCTYFIISAYFFFGWKFYSH